MERIALFLVLGAFLTGSMYAVSMQRDTRDADSALSRQQFRELSRQTARIGLTTTARRLAADASTSWVPSTYNVASASHDGGTYSVTVQSVGGSTDTVDVFVMGVYGPDTTQIDARYKRAFDTEGAPPPFRSVILADDLDHNAGTIQASALDPDFNANVHVNHSLSTNGYDFDVEGYGTYSNPASQAAFQSADFTPGVDYNGLEPDVLQVPRIEVPDTLLSSGDPTVTLVHPGDLILEPSTSGIQAYNVWDRVYNPASGRCYDASPPANCFGPGGTPMIGTEVAFVWYVEGDVRIRDTEFVYASGASTPPAGSPKIVIYAAGDPMTAALGSIELQGVVEGPVANGQTSLLFRASGSIEVQGSSDITASLWSPQEIRFAGTPAVTGNILAREVTFDGIGTLPLRYAPPSPAITAPGFKNTAAVGPELIGYAEWTTPSP